MSVISSRLLAVAAVFAPAADLAMPAGFAALSARNQAARQGANLISPYIKVPGTTMPMVLPDDKERGDVIAYLTTLK